VPSGGTYLYRRIVAEQVGRRDVLDFGVVNHGPERGSQPVDVGGLRFYEQVKVFGETGEAMQAHRDGPKDRVSNVFAFERREQSLDDLEIHGVLELTVDRRALCDRSWQSSVRASLTPPARP
jgi:hypothetical protein